MSHLTWRRMVWICTLAAISSSLYAADGVVLIDQNSALAGNVTPGDQAGFPVDISQPGSYRLSGNLTVPDVNTTAIRITADDVTLDLNGFRLVGPNVCKLDPTTCDASGEGSGVITDSSGPVSPRGVRVLNGTVRGMGLVGIWLRGDESTVERVNASGNGAAGIIVGLDGAVIDSVASINASWGIIAARVLDSTAEKNSDAGIIIRTGGVAIGNLAISNGGNGITATEGSTLTGNTANRNKGFGIDAACSSSIVANTAVANEAGNIRTNGACTLANNAQ